MIARATLALQLTHVQVCREATPVTVSLVVVQIVATVILLPSNVILGHGIIMAPLGQA